MVNRKGGIVLIVVISLLAVLAFTSISFVTLSHASKVITRQYIDNVRVNSLMQSGFEFAIADLADLSTQSNLPKIHLGQGTYTKNGDFTETEIQDLNGKINLNDGIKAGALEISPAALIPYDPNALDPYPETFAYSTNQSALSDKSALINLRLRYILNAYGDVHRFVDHAFDDDYQNCSDMTYYGSDQKPLPTPVYSTRTPSFFVFPTPLAWDNYKGSSDSPPGFTVSYDQSLTLDQMEYNNALGDRILEKRPDGGFKSWETIEEIVNMWAADPGIELSEDYLNGKSFFELIRKDLTLESYEDSSFFRLQTEPAEYLYQSVKTEATDYSNFPVVKKITVNQHGKIYKPATYNNLRDFGSNVFGPNFPPKISFSFPNFSNHSVALINLNEASFHVKAAIFYAPTNVSYSVETASRNYSLYSLSQALKDNINNENFDETTAVESGITLPAIGVSPPVFKLDSESLENGHLQDNQGNPIGRKSHLMSLRDAMHLANQYEIYKKEEKTILNFDDFRKFLIWHEQKSTDALPSFERVHSLNSYQSPSDKKEDFTGEGFYHISEYLDNSQKPAHSEFSQDYISKTLPHIFSCVRRIPGYLNAPLALQSPYILMKSSHEEPLNSANATFRKVEDFVKRSHIPKVCFLSQGFHEVQSIGKLLDAQGNVTAHSESRKSIKAFETKYYRTQKEFIGITFEAHPDIKIGPEVVSADASLSLGFVGLHDFDQDIAFGDPITGYKPQIVMNFKPVFDPNDVILDGGFTNTSQNHDLFPPPQPQDPKNDPWANKISGSGLSTNLGKAALLNNPSPMEGVGGTGAEKIISLAPDVKASDLSAFNGASFSGSHGNSPDRYGFNDSLYWRLDDWLQDSSEPVGERLSAGLITFWCRTPSEINDPIPIPVDIPVSTNPLLSFITKPVHFMHDSITRVFVSLNFWETLTGNTNLNPTMRRPVSIHVGMKKTPARGLNIFARYDSGGPSHRSSAPAFPSVLPSKFTSFPPSSKTPLTTQYDYLGFLCLSLDPPEDNIYERYRNPTYRSSEVSIRLKDVREALGWLRIGVAWNLGFPGDHKKKPEEQLWIKLYNNSLQDGPSVVRESYVDGHYPTAPAGSVETQDPLTLEDAATPGENAKYPSGDGGKGFMLPFDVAMTLSIGEAHCLRLTPYSDKGSDKGYEANNYFSGWRAGTAIDGLRIWIGRSDPNDPFTPHEHLDPDSDVYSKTVLTAMRYNITRPGGSYSMPGDNYAEPEWIIDPKFAKGTRILSVGTRVYYPTDPTDPTSSINYPYVRLSALEKKGNQKKEIKPFDLMSENEQDLFYPFYAIESENNPILISLKYMAHQPKLNGKQNDVGAGLDYFGSGVTNIPWIEEVSTRFRPKGYPLDLSSD